MAKQGHTTAAETKLYNLIVEGVVLLSLFSCLLCWKWCFK